MIMHDSAASRYSRALFEYAKEKGQIDEYLSQLSSCAMVFRDNKELMTILNHPNLSHEDKESVLKNVFSDLNEEMFKLVELLVQNDRIEEIQFVYSVFRSDVYEYKGIRVADVTTAVSMTEEEKNELSEKLSVKYSSKFEINNIVNPSVIGGVYLQIGDEVIDGTVRGSIEKMRKELFKQGNEVEA